jgi:hypothetical protein
MNEASTETVRLRFRIDLSEQLSGLLTDGYSREEFSRRMDNLIDTFNVAMYQRVLRSRETGYLAPAASFNVHLGPEAVRVHVEVSPFIDSHVTMDIVPSESFQAHSISQN